MIKEDFDIVNRKLENIIGKEMDKPTREGAMLGLVFSGLGEEPMSEYTLLIYSRFRFVYCYDIIVTHNDIFNPSNKYLEEDNFTKDDFDDERFNNECFVKGNNYFDEIADKTFLNSECKFIVKNANINMFGDLKIVFENGFILETFIDMSHYYDCWEFSEIDSGECMIIGSKGMRVEIEDKL